MVLQEEVFGGAGEVSGAVGRFWSLVATEFIGVFIVDVEVVKQCCSCETLVFVLPLA